MMNHSNQQINYWHWKLIWKTKIRHKVACFVWVLAKETVLRQDNWMRRGNHLCSRCFFCGEKAEIVNPLFLHCKVTGQIWRIFLNLKAYLGLCLVKFQRHSRAGRK
ncbi:hypothetical protein MTR67_030460 [Solanum verrucosum]|uniref:Reverse transcriptase zinc-binding domain-containing protein n=1 Tax=Solanum verrucosum TaxID=315347 RepID=A0AAF0U0Q5_SOLVR|nr:hypothetical protein MTR67_030460 [Solanum verrucosum]